MRLTLTVGIKDHQRTRVQIGECTVPLNPATEKLGF